MRIRPANADADAGLGESGSNGMIIPPFLFLME
jgi:hypothetical protein